MPCSEPLFGPVEPIGVWVSLSDLWDSEDAGRIVSVRIKMPRKRSITITKVVDRYSPENTILRAVCEVLKDVERAQEPLTRSTLNEWIDTHIKEYVDPF